MDANTLLAISEPERLFGPSEENAKARYGKLIREWHPDKSKNAQASEVSSHLGMLYRLAIDKIKSGTWCSPDTLMFTDTKGVQHSYAFSRRHETETGFVYIGPTLIYQLRHEFDDLFEHGGRLVSRLQFSSPRMKEQFAPQFPMQARSYKSATDSYLIVENSNRDILLADLENIPAKHAAWIISRLLNIRCYLYNQGLTHNGIDEHSITVNPANHHIWLAGGWWYSRKAGDDMKALPAHLISCVPASVLKSKMANSIVDGEQIRALARKLFLDAPKPMLDWSKHPAGKDAIADFKYWRETVLIQSFGEIKFAKYDVSFNDVYGE